LALGCTKDMYSGRVEAFRLLAALIFLQYYIQSYSPTQFSDSSINCFCENLGIITIINDMMTPTIIQLSDTTNDDRDVYLAINDVIKQCTPLQLSFQHIMGHQDKHSNQPLTIIEQLNVECDHKAKQYITSMTISSTSFGNPAIPLAQPHIWIDR